jgi:molecular chaperone DnaK (HSP70)
MQIGIDIGTHRAHVAYLGTDGVPQIIRHRDGATSTAAYIRQLMHSRLVGEPAAESLIGNRETTLIGCTRLMGRAQQLPAQLLDRLPYTVRAVDGEAVCDLLYAELPASEAYGLLARHLADTAEQATGQVVERVVLTVPAGAEDRFRVQARAAVEARKPPGESANRRDSWPGTGCTGPGCGCEL